MSGACKALIGEFAGFGLFHVFMEMNYFTQPLKLKYNSIGSQDRSKCGHGGIGCRIRI